MISAVTGEQETSPAAVTKTVHLQVIQLHSSVAAVQESHWVRLQHW